MKSTAFTESDYWIFQAFYARRRHIPARSDTGRNASIVCSSAEFVTVVIDLSVAIMHQDGYVTTG
jgi:hypothetical protein